MENGIERGGRCLCGAVRLHVRAASRSVGACHCGMCRKWTGGPLLAVECGSAVDWQGEDAIAVFNSSDWAERGFCKVCGTHLFYRLKKEGAYYVPVGLFEDGGPWVFDHQIFIDEKPAFYAFANETTELTGAEVFAQFAGTPG